MEAWERELDKRKMDPDYEDPATKQFNLECRLMAEYDRGWTEYYEQLAREEEENDRLRWIDEDRAKP